MAEKIDLFGFIESAGDGAKWAVKIGDTSHGAIIKTIPPDDSTELYYEANGFVVREGFLDALMAAWEAWGEG